MTKRWLSLQASGSTMTPVDGDTLASVAGTTVVSNVTLAVGIAESLTDTAISLPSSLVSTTVAGAKDDINDIREPGAVVIGAGVVVAAVVGATVVGAAVVGATVAGTAVVGAAVVGATVVGATVVGTTVLGAAVVGAAVVGGTVDGPGLESTIRKTSDPTATRFALSIVSFKMSTRSASKDKIDQLLKMVSHTDTSLPEARDEGRQAYNKKTKTTYDSRCSTRGGPRWKRQSR